MWSKTDDLEKEVDRIISGVAKWQRRNPQSWPTWRQVAKVVYGTDEEAERLAAIVELPEYRDLFVLDKREKHVKLSDEGIARMGNIGQCVSITGDEPGAVAEAVRQYASALGRVHVKVEEIRPVRNAGDKCVQAMFLEMDDTRLQHGTPVGFRPKNGGFCTRGRIVGQNEDDGCVFVAMDTEVWPDALPGILSIDRAYMSSRLAEQIGTSETIPARPKPLTTADRSRAVAAANAIEAAHVLATAVRPWTRLLWGPPGAGKTFAMANLVAELLRENPSMNLLLTAPSNLAADVLLDEVVRVLEQAGMSELVRQRKVLRYGYPEKSTVLECEDLLGPAGATDLAQRVKTCKHRLAEAERKRPSEADLAVLRAELLQAQQNLKQLVRDHVHDASIVVTSTHLGFLPDSPVSDKRWSIVVIDEVTMVPPAVCYFLGSLAEEAFLLAGDPRQLGPVTEADRTLSDGVQRWMGTDVFEFAGIANGQGESRVVDDSHPLLMRITEQRRCSPGIWQVIEHAYPGITSNPPAPCSGVKPSFDPLPESHVVLLDTCNRGEDRCGPQKKSWRNENSAELALEVASALVGDYPDPDVEIAIITPFRAQAALLKKMLRSERDSFEMLKRVQVGTVHQFQGSAADVVIFDVVEDFGRNKLTKVLQGDSGVRLVNVAVSRARHKLIVIANRVWHRARTNQQSNPLLWRLIVNCNNEDVFPVVEVDPSTKDRPPRYESADEARLGEAMREHAELSEVITQHRILREDGTLVSRADFAIPDIKYAVYVDGAEWHLTRKGWARDKRLRGELRAIGWTVRVFSGHEVRGNPRRCAGYAAQDVQSLCASEADVAL